MAILLLGFIALFLFRLAFGYTKDVATEQTLVSGDFMEIVQLERKNYATKKYKVTAGQSPVRVDQKYEKIAEISSTTSEFDEVEKQLRGQIAAYDGLIQFENKRGNPGTRHTHLVIGVPPENFDDLYAQLTKLGKILSKQITKKDKTNEYKELNAKKLSLQNIRASLVELKLKGGKIEEFMQLENRILEIDQQLQDLGVSLGNFDDENEFCTVKFSLSEGREIEIGILQRIKVALEWTIVTYLKITASLFFMALFAYCFLLGVEKLGLLQKIHKGIDQ